MLLRIHIHTQTEQQIYLNFTMFLSGTERNGILKWNVQRSIRWKDIEEKMASTSVHQNKMKYQTQQRTVKVPVL